MRPLRFLLAGGAMALLLTPAPAQTVAAQLNKVAMVRLAAAGPDGKEIAFADHEMDKSMPMCNLPFTGTRGGAPLLLGGGGLVVLGTLALVLVARRARKQDSAGERAA